MSTADRITAVLDKATAAHNTPLAAAITRARSLSDDEAEVMHQHLRSTSAAARAAARKAIDEAEVERSFTTGERDLIGQISEAGDAGWYAAGEAAGEAVKIAVSTGKWSALGDSDEDRYWVAVWNSAWWAASDAARAYAARDLLADDEVEQRHYDSLLASWRAAEPRTGTGTR